MHESRGWLTNVEAMVAVERSRELLRTGSGPKDTGPSRTRFHRTAELLTARPDGPSHRS